MGEDTSHKADQALTLCVKGYLCPASHFAQIPDRFMTNCVPPLSVVLPHVVCILRIVSLVSSAFSPLCISWCFWSCATTRGQVSVCSPMSTASGSTSYNQLILKITNTTVRIQPNRDQGGERITQRVSVLCVPFVVLCDERETQNSLWYLNKSATCSILWVLTLVKCPIKVLIYEQINECVFQLPVTT